MNYATSQMNRVMQCLGSTVLPADRIAPRSSTPKEEGDAAHYVAKKVFRNEAVIESLIDTQAPNGFYITADMCENVAEYVNAIFSANSQFNEVDVETRIDGDGWSIAGRADHIALNGQTLYVDGFHYGFRIVPAEFNWTLICHAIGFCIANNIAPETIVIGVHQPRAFRPQSVPAEWAISYEQLTEFHRQLFAHLGKKQRRCHTGPACVTCDLAHGCPALTAAAHNAIDASDEALPHDLDGEQLAGFLLTLETAKAHLDAKLKSLQEAASHRLESGGVVPNYALERSQGSLKWNPGLSPEIISALIGQNVSRPGVITPSQAKKQFSIPDTLLQTLAKRETTTPKLTRVSADARARRIFAKGKPQ